MILNRHPALFRIGLVAILAAPAAAHPDPSELNTAAESFRRGLEGVFRVAGNTSSKSAASSPAIDAQTANGMSYDHQIKYTNTYFQKRQLNRMVREAERGPRNTSSDFSRWNRARAPQRLSSSQIDTFDGRINWPVVLRGDAFKKDRLRLDVLYAEHAVVGGGMHTREYAPIQRHCQAMEKQLRTQIDTTTPEQYSYAQRFLESLRYEARQPTGA